MRTLAKACIDVELTLSWGVIALAITMWAIPPIRMPVSIEQALYLVRSTLLTLNDANLPGNYTVLRDLAAPDFQARNTAAELGETFSDLRRRNFDLYGAALLAPQLTVVPALDQSGMLPDAHALREPNGNRMRLK